jgi:hypothetical protein
VYPTQEELKPIAAPGSQFYDLSTINREVRIEMGLLCYLFYDISYSSLALEDAINVMEKALCDVCMQDCVQTIERKGRDEYNYKNAYFQIMVIFLYSILKSLNERHGTLFALVQLPEHILS